MRDFLLRFLVLAGAAAAVITEALSPFHLLRRGPLSVAWLFVACAGAVWVWGRRGELRRPRFDPLETAIGAAILAIAAAIGVAAALSPPNTFDAMAYHMPRVLYWAQSGSVAFFPTPFYNQIQLQPFAEYLMLHTYVLSGGDHFVNFVAFAGFLGSVVAVSTAAREMGLKSRGQAYAALFCATLPSGILQASGAKNDCLLSLWLAALVVFTLRRKAPFAALCFGLALATKATAYLFAPPVIAAAWVIGNGREFRARAADAARFAAWLAAGALLLNGPQYARNYSLSGFTLGFDSAHGDGLFRWRNEHPGWKSTVSNALRNASEQLGARSSGWNQGVFDFVVRVHHALGIDPQDPATTWPWSRYAPPYNARNHEADANNRWHLLLLAAALPFAAIARRRDWVAYGCALLSAVLLFCFYLKWQPYMARMELPLFVLAAPLAGWALESVRPLCLAVAACVLLANNARAPLFENWTRPMHGPRNLFTTTRDENYFADMSQARNRSWYLEAVDLTARSGCTLVGIDIGEYQLEYPFQALTLERNPAVRFVHTGVTNASARYYPKPAPQPCAVLCLECVGNERKAALYAPVGPPSVIGRFVLFLREPPSQK